MPIKYYRCYDCKKGLDTAYNQRFFCNKCGSNKFEGMRRVSMWEALRLYVMTDRNLLVIDSQWPLTKLWRAVCRLVRCNT
jgi:hypothetical protein